MRTLDTQPIHSTSTTPATRRVVRTSISPQDLEETTVKAKAHYIGVKIEQEENFKHVITQNIAQDHLQYASQIFQEDLRDHFENSYEEICEVQNKYLELWHAILQIEPTIAMRTILGREDISARFVGPQVLHVHPCTPIEVATIFRNHTVNGTCYLETPVITKEGELLFLNPGSKDLFPSGKDTPCE
ncbi:unnamed protein product, partial [Auanema sp. JU1783]